MSFWRWLTSLFRGHEPVAQAEQNKEENPMTPPSNHNDVRETSLESATTLEQRYDPALLKALERVNTLIRAQTERWRDNLAAHKPAELWGMIQVSHEEIAAYLNSPFTLPGFHSAVTATTIEETTATSRISRLQTLFNLQPLERDILLLCLLPELDSRYRRLYGYLMDDASRTLPNVELLVQILEPVATQAQARLAFSPDAPLIRDHLVSLVGVRGDEGLSMHSVRIEERLVNYLLGEDKLDRSLVDVVSLAPNRSWEELIVDESEMIQLKNLAKWWGDLANQSVTVFMHGPYGNSSRGAAEAICTNNDTLLLVVTPATLPPSTSWEKLLDLVYREATLQQAAVYWAGCESLLEDSATLRWNSLLSATEQFAGLTFLSSQKAWDPMGRSQQTFIHLSFPTPDYSQRLRLWQHHLPEQLVDVGDRAILISDLANSFQFTEGQMLDALAIARAEAYMRNALELRLTSADIFEGCRRQSSRRLIKFATRVRPRTSLSFTDLILPTLNKRQLTELSDRIRNRNKVYVELGLERRLSLGRGIVALFTGTSGTGKTMAAELLARQQGVDLYKVDLSAVVSKYVGETEKNLAQVFSEAEDANAILFFDEADSLFGKRGEVKEAQDRWANMEVNYLLQRIEEYAGVVILASNLKQNIDEAFKRRIQVIVDFPFPDDAARLAIYRGMFPPLVERPDDKVLGDLSKRFKLSGGSIKNIVVDATFRAVEEQRKQPETRPTITTQHLVLATAREYQKLGKPMTKGEFGEEYYKWLEGIIL
jgi:hypothetical protein